MDGFLGYRQVTPCTSLSTVDAFKALVHLIYTRYNANGHKVTDMVSDSLPALTAAVPMLGAMGILLSLTPPVQHAQHIEHSVGSMAGRRRAPLTGLPYILHVKYEVFSEIWVAHQNNSARNVCSHPSTPDILVTSARRSDHYKHSHLQFGYVCRLYHA